MVRVCLRVGPGGKRGLVAGTLQFSLPAPAGNVIRVPIIPVNTERSVRPGGRGDSVFARGAPHHAESACQRPLKLRLAFP